MELLDEIWQLIFARHLDAVDTLRCRRVSKRFRFLVDQLCLTELAVYGHKPSMPGLCSPCYGDYDHDPFHWIQVYQFDFGPNSSSFQIVFRNLKFLQLDLDLKRNCGKIFNLELLNEFTGLEKLYTNTVVIRTTQTLRLPRLKVFSIKLYSEREYDNRPATSYFRFNYKKQPRLVLDSKVEKLFCARATILLVINHPENIKFLEYRRDDLPRNSAWGAEQLILFKNLKILYSPVSKTVADAFQELKKLDELHLDRFEGGARNWNEQKQFISQLMKTATSSSKVKIYFSGVSAPFEWDGKFIPLNLKIANYHKLADCVSEVKEINYENLTWCLNDQRANFVRNGIALNESGFPVDFFRKFRYIKIVEIDQRVGLDELAPFLSQCTRLTKLKFWNNSLSQPLLDQLPMLCGSLKMFSVSDSSDISLDFWPVYGLKKLFKLEVDSKGIIDTPLDLVRLFKSCRYLVYVRLKYVRNEKKGMSTVHASGNCVPKCSFEFLHQKIRNWNYDGLEYHLEVINEDCKEFGRKLAQNCNLNMSRIF